MTILVKSMAAGMFSTIFAAGQASAQEARRPEARNVLLVHGAWADGSS